MYPWEWYILIWRNDTHRMARGRSPSSSSAWGSEDEESQSEEQSGESTSADDEQESWSLGKRASAKNLRRLRRIFLNRPRKQRPRSPLKPKAKPVPLERRRTREEKIDSDSPRHLKRGSSWERDTSELGSTRRRSIDRLEERRPMRLAIDHHIQSLCDHVKRLSVQRDSNTNQVHSMLEHAIEELEFLRKQEERALQIQIKQIHESFALRLEIFEQQYLSKVAEIQQEMHAAIQREKESCDATILTAAKKLQEQTQLALLKELPTRQTCSRPGSPQRTTAPPSSYLHRTGADSVRKAEAKRESKPSQLSPMSRQKAKLRALEAKLATFSKEAIDRVDNQKKQTRKASIAWSVTETHATERVPRPPAFDASRESRTVSSSSSWQPTPLSPLRKHESFWRNGISLEAAGFPGPSDADRGRQKRPSSVFTSRFLLPEEEQELRSLRNSIGLAKDWMETHNAR